MELFLGKLSLTHFLPRVLVVRNPLSILSQTGAIWGMPPYEERSSYFCACRSIAGALVRNLFAALAFKRFTSSTCYVLS
eukprot:scaffold198192_cov19-Tisochrysis_lutea.AAC.2